MTARVPASISVAGSLVELEPRTPASCAELRDALWRPEVFAGGFGGGPAAMPAEAAAFGTWLDQYTPDDALSALVRLRGGPQAGRAVGTTSLYEFVPHQESCLLGYTAYHPGVWGSGVNAECKLLLLRLAFSSGFGRVELRADARNARSRAAILRAGATFEGIRRRDRLCPDGSWRDAAIYSVIIDDWPGVEHQLEHRVAAAMAPVRMVTAG